MGGRPGVRFAPPAPGGRGSGRPLAPASQRERRFRPRPRPAVAAAAHQAQKPPLAPVLEGPPGSGGSPTLRNRRNSRFLSAGRWPRPPSRTETAAARRRLPLGAPATPGRPTANHEMSRASAHHAPPRPAGPPRTARCRGFRHTAPPPPGRPTANREMSRVSAHRTRAAPAPPTATARCHGLREARPAREAAGAAGAASWAARPRRSSLSIGVRGRAATSRSASGSS